MKNTAKVAEFSRFAMNFIYFMVTEAPTGDALHEDHDGQGEEGQAVDLQPAIEPAEHQGAQDGAERHIEIAGDHDHGCPQAAGDGHRQGALTLNE